jgi:hypothetical protein
MWKVTIIDKLDNAIVAEESFQGPDLPWVVKGTIRPDIHMLLAEEPGITITLGGILRKPPIDEVKNYIEKLPKHK